MLSISKKPLISFRGLQKSARLLKDFVLFYFPIYDLSMEDFFDYYPILSFSEAMIYQTDLLLEEGHREKDPWSVNRSLITKLLLELDLHDEEIERELDALGEYIAIENKLLSSSSISASLVRKASELRTSDLRFLHRILVKYLKIPYEEELFELIWPLEILADIEDDLVQYKEDVSNKEYNTYDMFVQLYKREASLYLEKEMLYYRDIYEKRLENFPSDIQEKWRRGYELYREQNPSPEIPKPLISE